MNGIEKLLETMRAGAPLENKEGEPLDVVIIWRGFMDFTRYVRDRYDGKEIFDMTEKEYMSALADYTASLVVHAESYLKFMKSNANVK